MILHIFNKQEKFSVEYIKFLKNSGFELKNHVIFHYGKSSGYFEENKINSVFSSFVNPIKHIELYKIMKKSDKIIVHSLASPFLLVLLMFKFKVTQKIYWVIWGKDLYFTKCVNMNNPIMKLYEFFRKRAIKNVKHVITNVEADFKLAEKWYGIKANLILSKGMSYPYNSDVSVKKFTEQNNKLKYVLLGNSGSISNNHLQALNILKKCDDGKMNIICPLSYGGNKKYINNVIIKGKNLFKDRFNPILEFMPLNKYNEILEKMDIAFFFHDRQEAFSNTLTLLNNGKKVYIRRESTLWNYFEQKNIKVHDSFKAENDFFVPDNLTIINSNSLLVNKIRDVKLAAECWKRVFEENINK